MYKRIIPGKSIKSLPRPPDDDTAPTIIPIPRITRKEHRKCERPNYVPHRTPSHSDRELWSYAYEPQLQDMHRIVGLMIERKYPKMKIDWSNPKYYKAFNKLIYHCSSKYITPYIEDRDDDALTASKELSDDDKGWERQRGN
jgi:hypothetical protein